MLIAKWNGKKVTPHARLADVENILPELEIINRTKRERNTGGFSKIAPVTGPTSLNAVSSFASFYWDVRLSRPFISEGVPAEGSREALKRERTY